MLVALNSIASAQAQGTEATLKACLRLLNYAATHPDAIIRFHASDMVVHTDSDASYLCAPKAKSRAAGYHYLSSHPDKLQPGEAPPLNGPIHVLCTFHRPSSCLSSRSRSGRQFHECPGALPNPPDPYLPGPPTAPHTNSHRQQMC